MRTPISYLLVHVLLLISRSCALDVSWLPSDADGDGPLRLSTRYRDNLRKLCTLLRSKRPPPELEEKRELLTKMCRRLASDDANAGTGSSSSSGGGFGFGGGRGAGKAVVAGLLGLGASYYAWTNRRDLVRQARRWLQDVVGPAARRRGAGLGGGDGAAAAAAAAGAAHDALIREARLRRFAAAEAAPPAAIDKLD